MIVVNESTMVVVLECLEEALQHARDPELVTQQILEASRHVREEMDWEMIPLEQLQEDWL